MDDQPRTTEPYPDTNTRSIYLGSTRLAHEHLVAQSQVVLRLGRILMSRVRAHTVLRRRWRVWRRLWG